MIFYSFCSITSTLFFHYALSEGEIDLTVDQTEALNAQLAVLMNALNSVTRPAFSWTYQALPIIDITIGNCSLTLARKQVYISMAFFLVLGILNVTAVLFFYFVLTRVEGLHKESLKLLRSLGTIDGESKGNSRKQKRRKERKLQDRKPTKRIYRMPLT